MSTTATSTDWAGTKVLRGFAEKHGTVGLYGQPAYASTHMNGPVPLDQARALLDVRFLEGDLSATVIDETGVRSFTDPTRKAIIHPATGAFMGVFKHGYRVHPYGGWLLDHAERIAGSGLQLASVGLVEGDAIAFAQWEMPDTVQMREGIAFRPYLTCGTSVNGTLSSTYLTGSTLLRCSNIFQGSGRTGAKVRHSAHSLTDARLDELQKKLELMTSGQAVAEQEAEVRQLVQTPVTDQQWSAFLDAHAMTSRLGKDGQPKGARGLTNADEVRAQFEQLWQHDDRAAEWKGTAWGVLMVDNTWRHWIQGTKGTTDRAERNFERAVKSQVGAADTSVMDTLARVLQPA